MNYQWTMNLHDEYPPFHDLMPGEHIPPSILTLYNILSTMFHFGVDFPHPTKAPQHDLPSLAPSKGKMPSSFSWTNLFKSPTSRPLCLGDPTLEKLNQVNISHLSLCATEFCDTKSIRFGDPGVHPFATKPHNTKTLPHNPKQVSMYLQEGPSTPLSQEPPEILKKLQSLMNSMTSPFPVMTLVDYFCSYPRHKSSCQEHKCPAHPHLHSTTSL